MAGSLSSDELNFLVYRYLLESGFVHSAFTFSHESLVARSNINSMEVPPGALISFVQKGLQYYEIEAHVHEDGTETVCDEPFSVITPHTCRVKSKRRVFESGSSTMTIDDDYGAREIPMQQVTLLKGHSDVICACSWNPQGNILATGSGDGTARLWEGTRGSGSLASVTEPPLVLHHNTALLAVALQSSSSSSSSSSPALESASSSSLLKLPISMQSVTPALLAAGSPLSLVSLDWSRDGRYLATGAYTGQLSLWSARGQLLHVYGSRHAAPVSALRFSPTARWLASAAMDYSLVVSAPLPPSSAAAATATAATSATATASSSTSTSAPMLLTDASSTTSTSPASSSSSSSPDASSASSSSSSAADPEGSSDAMATDPSSSSSSSSSSPPVAAEMVASDSTAIVPVPPASLSAPFDLRLHKAPILDLDWRDDNVLASCSADGVIYVHWFNQASSADGKESSVEIQDAHDKEINSVRWSPDGKYLASGSDDQTIKIWQPISDSSSSSSSTSIPTQPQQFELVHELREHGREVCLVRWSPSTSSSSSISMVPRPQLLASASMDTTVKVWLAESGRCVHTLSEHSLPVTALEFSPAHGGDLLASVAHDRLHVWNTRDGKLVKTHKASSGINEISWSPAGDRIAACLSNNTVTVVQL